MSAMHALHDAFTVGDFRIDLNSGSAAVRGFDLHLTRPELDLLVFLISHRKSMVTTRTMLSTKADGNGLRQAEFLRTLSSLREKINAAVPGTQYLRTETWTLYDFHPGS